MSRTLATATATGIAGVALALVLAACSGASDDTSSKKDVAPTEPTTSSGSSGKATSGGPSSSGSSGSSGMTSSSSGSSGMTSGGTDAGGDGPVTNCVAKGYGGNDKKVGAYCDKDVSCPFQVDPFLVCTYGHDPTNTHLFCTAPCSKDSECGTGAYCMHDPKGNGCVPTQCGGMPGM